MSTEHHKSKYAELTYTVRPLQWGQKVNFFLYESDHVAYQIIEKEV